ncbi:hypothetical protein VNO78_06338 [Psophocarpus tetragonolobus]|uniref:C-JID domain-containing protein n=1 Tax=Psophocarpus tetragonolobus TaxID=3891 RepID=A0AAN9SUZ5_PSOTE
MRYSKIKQLWEGTKTLYNLRCLILSYSKSLIELPNIRKAPNLEVVDLQGCLQLKQIRPYIGHLRKLNILNLKDCKSLVKLPHLGEALNLQELDLEGCTQLRHIDPSIGLLKKLSRLNLENCKNLVSLPNSMLGLTSLQYLSLRGCLKLYNIQLLDEPRDVMHLTMHLKKLYICEAPIHSQSTASYFKENRSPFSCLVPSSRVFPCMHELDVSFCNLVQTPDAIGNLCCLERLDLSRNNFATLPNLNELSKLVYLRLQHCKQLKSLPKLPSQIDFSPPFLWRHFGRDIGLYIFNCPKLLERECCINMGFSWMIQILQGHHLHQYFEDNMGCQIFSSIIPGSEIPRWFNNQHVGNLVSIDASPVMNDNNWIGIAFCAIFSVPRETVLATGPSNAKVVFRDFGDIPVDFYGDPELVSDESYHMWQFFVNRRKFSQQCGLSSFLKAHLGSLKRKCRRGQEPGFHSDVKKYGYRWVYKHDLESNPRKRKFFAVEHEGRRSKARTSTKWEKEAT